MYKIGDKAYAYNKDIFGCGMLGEIVGLDSGYAVVKLDFEIKGHTVVRCPVRNLKPSHELQKKWDQNKGKNNKLPMPSANIGKLSEKICKALTKIAR
jgi:hypothetical protein